MTRFIGYGLFAGLCFIALVFGLGIILVHGAQAQEEQHKHKEWFLIVPIYHCDTCISREERLVMPSIETCRKVRDHNPGTRCITQDDEPSQ